MKAALLALLALAPPSGRPPLAPLERYEPRVYDLRFEVTINTDIPYLQNDPRLPHDRRQPSTAGWGGLIDLADTPIVMPMIFEGAYSRIRNGSVRAELFLQSRRDPQLASRFRIEEGIPHHARLAVIPIPRFRGKTIRWSVSYREQSWASRINDAAAAQIPWPRQWPEEVADGLSPQLYIESGDALFHQTVERVTRGRIRFLPPYLVAKALVQYAIKELPLSGAALARGRLGILHGMNVIGARRAAAQGRGGPNDLVCVCVAMLRAAGIPARPVIGVEEDEKGHEVFVVWAEFYLPRAGWVPFDPIVMRGRGAGSRDLRQPWPEFGTMDDLNRRVPLAYAFIPPREVQSPQYPAVWGWDPRPHGAPPAEQMISIGMISRGPGVNDPR